MSARPKRAAAKVTDYRKYHLSGDLDTELQGRVDARVSLFEMSSSPEELQWQLEAEKLESSKLQQEAESLRLQTELENEKLKQNQWKAAMDKLKEARENAFQQHEQYMEKLKEAAKNTSEDTSAGILDWFQSQMAELGTTGEPPRLNEEQERRKREQEAREREIRDLHEQQEQITRKLAELGTGGKPENNPPLAHPLQGHRQEDLLQQLKMTLAGKKEEDPNRALLKALITSHNKTAGEGGTNTLKPTIINSIFPGEGANTMADWLANLNK